MAQILSKRRQQNSSKSFILRVDDVLMRDRAVFIARLTQRIVDLTRADEMIYIIFQKPTMRYPSEHKQQTRQRIVKAASRRFRSRGTEGATIGTLMHDLRLTHGGFYRHFDNKEELFIEAFGESLEDLSRNMLSALEDVPPGDELKALINRYLSGEHSDNVAGGCPVAALAAEVARRPPKTRAALLQILKSHIAKTAKFIPGATEEERVRKARVLLSGMAGTLNIARVIVDEGQRRQFLEDAKKFYFEAAQK